MTTHSTRGDALASAVEAYMNPECHMTWRDLEEALATYRASQVEGERVKVAIWRNKAGGIMGFSADTDGAEYGISPPDFYVTFTLPPRTTPPTVEGEVCE